MNRAEAKKRIEQLEQKTGSRAQELIITGLHEDDYEGERLASFMFQGVRYPIERLEDFEVKYAAKCIIVNWTDAAPAGTWPDANR